MRAIAGAFLGSLAPYLVYRFALEYYDLRASLTNLTPKRLLVLAVAYSIANPLFHHLWFALTGTTKNWFESFFSMFIGDLTRRVDHAVFDEGNFGVVAETAEQFPYIEWHVQHSTGVKQGI